MTPTGLAITCLIAVTICYAARCVGSPFGDCRTCRGLGYTLRTDRRGEPKRGKTCRRCNGHGKRIRVGRRLLNLAAAFYRDGTT